MGLSQWPHRMRERRPVVERRDGRTPWAVPTGVLAVVVAVVPLVPPLLSWSAHDAWAEALSFGLFAVVVPALVVLAAPWQLIGLGPAADRLAQTRRRHPEALRTAAVAAVYVATDIAWRTPYAITHLSHDKWLVILQASTLVLTGTALWLELVRSPPLSPRSPRPTRAALAAGSMWSIWILAYLLGMASSRPYAHYRLQPPGSASHAADSQIATGILWFIAGCAFIPVVFSSLMQWLRSEENPDEELHRLVAEERRRGRGGT
jgi:cytochrome c oxidase assembly factor CtaG